MKVIVDYLLTGRMERARSAIAAIAAVAAVGGCGMMPSEPPKFEQVYVVEAASLDLSAYDLSPDAITLNADSSAFLFTSDSTIINRSLGQLCSTCGAANGTSVPKPAFNTTFSTTIATTANLVSASITGGTIDLRLTNNLNFDPIRPSATARGTISMTIRRGTTTIATYTAAGTAMAFAPGSVIGGPIAITPFTFDGPLTVDVNVNSPAGDAVVMDTSRSIRIKAGPMAVAVSQVTVTVTGQTFSDTSDLDLTNTEGELGDKIQGGAFRFNFTNPFAVGGNFSLTFRDASTGATLLSKSITLAQSATSSARIALTKSEIESLLGQEIEVIVSGGFNAPSGQLTLTPKQVATFTSLLEITVLPFGD